MTPHPCQQACRTVTFVWRSGNAPDQFMVIVIIAVLVLAFWAHYRRETDGREG